MKQIILLIVVTAISALPVIGAEPDKTMETNTASTIWQKELARQLPIMGHRNWIAVVDSAYPSQTAPGIKTIYTGEQQLDVVDTVLTAVNKAKHVRGVLFVDAELPYVPEKNAKGIEEYRKGLDEVLEGQDVTSLLHDEIIKQLDEAGQNFHVLILKTDLTLPYTSVFIRLDCGYWSDDAEQEMRKAIEATKTASKSGDSPSQDAPVPSQHVEKAR